MVSKSLLERTLTSSEGESEGRKGKDKKGKTLCLKLLFFVFFVLLSCQANLLFDALSPYTHPTGAWGIRLARFEDYQTPYLRQAFLAGKVYEGRGLLPLA